MLCHETTPKSFFGKNGHVVQKHVPKIIFRGICFLKFLIFVGNLGSGATVVLGSGPENYSPDLPPHFQKLFGQDTGRHGSF